MLKTCPKCQKQIEGEILICPNCGYDFDFLKTNFNKFIQEHNLSDVWSIVWKICAVLLGLEFLFVGIKMAYPTIGQHYDLTLLNGLTQFNYIVFDYGLPLFVIGLFFWAVFIKKSEPSKNTKTPQTPPVPVTYTLLDKILYKNLFWFFAIFAGLCFVLIAVLIYVLASDNDEIGANMPPLQNINSTAQITDFTSCAAAGNPVMESYPRQCRANGQNFVEVISENLNVNANVNLNSNINVNAPGEPTCKNMCGDGVCAEIVCLAIGCPCSETAASCPQDCKIAPTGDTGVVSGTITLGPTCPVQRIPPDSACADKPYQTTIQIIAVGSPLSSPFKVINSDAQGNYTVTLPVGEYNFQPQGGTMLPRCNNQDVTVTAGASLRVDFSCDTGIR